MRICILGAGALGSVIGGFLAKTGVEVTLIGREKHINAINQHGLTISGRQGDHVIQDHLQAVSHPDDAQGDFDYLILLVKAKDTEAALLEARVLVPRVKTVLSLQNGLGAEQSLTGLFGSDKVIGAVTVEGAELVAPGHVRNTVTANTTVYVGELAESALSNRVEILSALFNAAGFSSKSVDNIDQVKWEKTAQIAAVSCWSASNLALVPELTFADGLLNPDAARNFVVLAKELLAVYVAKKYLPQNYFAPLSWNKELYELPIDEAVEHFARIGQQLIDRGQALRSSMHIDVLNKRKTEVDTILKPFIDEALLLSVPVPSAQYVYGVIKTMDAGLS